MRHMACGVGGDSELDSATGWDSHLVKRLKLYEVQAGRQNIVFNKEELVEQKVRY